MKVDDVSIGDLVRVWNDKQLSVVTDTYFDLHISLWCFDAYGLQSREVEEGIHFDNDEITIVSRA